MNKPKIHLNAIILCAIWLGAILPASAFLSPTDALAAQSGPNSERPPLGQDDPDYLRAVQRTADMVWDEHTRQLAAQYGLDLINLTWEDTGRYYGSSVGPNISDATIQVQTYDPQSNTYQLTLMPVIRYPNFSDLSADISPDDFFLLVGNEIGEDLQRVTLTEYLKEFRSFLSEPYSWRGNEDGLWASRDSHVLVSAQAAFLPVPEQGKAEFNPVLFNYQSYQENPAVLVIVATREGTSATIIDNVRDGFAAGQTWGQRLFFNQDGERASFTGERLSDFHAGTGNTDPGTSPMAARESGLNMVLLIQVPLKQREPLRSMVVEEAIMGFAAAAPTASMQKSDVEAAVIGHGKVEGPFTEVDGLAIERDPDFPVRVTVQFYKATSNGIVNEADMAEIAAQIERVYQEADYVGSLVVDGPSDRPTEYTGDHTQPEGWWEAFWQRFEANTGLSRFEARYLLHSLRAFAGYWWERLPRVDP